MKRFNHTIGFFAAAALVACTGDFESFNTNPDAVQSVDKKTYITTMQMDAVIPCSDVGANEFQRACNLMGDAFGGYLLPDPGLQRRQLYLYLRPRRYGLQQRAFLGGFHQCDACMAQPQVRLPERTGYRRCLCRCRGHQGDGPPAYHRHLRPDPRFEFRPDRKPLRIAGDRLQKTFSRI